MKNSCKWFCCKQVKVEPVASKDMLPDDISGQPSNMWMGAMFESDRDDLETMPDLDMPNLDMGSSGALFNV